LASRALWWTAAPSMVHLYGSAVQSMIIRQTNRGQTTAFYHIRIRFFWLHQWSLFRKKLFQTVILCFHCNDSTQTWIVLPPFQINRFGKSRYIYFTMYVDIMYI
jgi:hypothetical protein